MNAPNTAKTITPEALKQLIAGHEPVILVDTLTEDHYKLTHLPGARNACVFRVDFLHQIRMITDNPQARIILYGASGTSMEAAVAAEKLDREGYAGVTVLDGGIRAWQAAGYALEGSSPSPPAPENVLTLADGTYRVDIDQSVVAWTGRNPNTTHDGTIGLSTGEIIISGGRPTGTFVIDMNTITNRSLAGDELQPVLIDHLQSDDFFFTRLFPTATFAIREGRLRGKPHLSAPNMDLKGELTLRGVTAGLDFTATAVQGPEGTITARARFDLDRTRWNIIIDVKIVAGKIT
jgi:polyisoprenoid-binding protein YceI